MFCAPGERTFSRVKVPKSPGSGKNFAKGKGVRCEAESEGSRIYISSRLLPWNNSVNLETYLHQMMHTVDCETGATNCQPLLLDSCRPSLCSILTGEAVQKRMTQGI